MLLLCGASRRRAWSAQRRDRFDNLTLDMTSQRQMSCISRIPVYQFPPLLERQIVGIENAFSVFYEVFFFIRMEPLAYKSGHIPANRRRACKPRRLYADHVNKIRACKAYQKILLFPGNMRTQPRKGCDRAFYGKTGTLSSALSVSSAMPWAVVSTPSLSLIFSAVGPMRMLPWTVGVTSTPCPYCRALEHGGR